jgi:hypothetical protein
MSDRDPLMRYRASTNVNSSRGELSQERVTPDRVSARGQGLQPAQVYSRERIQSVDASVRQSGRGSSPRGAVVNEHIRQEAAFVRPPHEPRADPSPVRSVVGANRDQLGSQSPDRSSPSRGGRTSHLSNDDMRREILNSKTWWTKICYFTCVLIALLLTIWFLAYGGIYFKEYVLKPGMPP